MLECVVNVSEGRDPAMIDTLASGAEADLLDVHSDPYHNRTVLTLVGEEAPRRVTRAAVELLDLHRHTGVHPRLGVADVVPFVPLAGSSMEDAVRARDAFAAWVADELAVPAFLYGAERSLPEVRRRAFDGLPPDHGPARPHPTAGAVAVGARPVLVAWNVYLDDATLAEARRIAAAIRRPGLRALGLATGDEVQVSMNLVTPEEIGPSQAWDLVAEHTTIKRAELVGLVPEAVMKSTPRARWAQLDLDANRTVEARLGAADRPYGSHRR